MKKLLLALALLVTGVAQAQITYETRYGAPLQAFKLSTGVVKYIGYFPSTNNIRIYNNDNSLYKSVALPTGATYAYGDFFYLSDKLFNNDSQLEFVTSIGVGSNNFVMKVFNENGTQLLSQDSCTSVQVFNTPLGAKMFARVYRANLDAYYKVYALAGTYTPLNVRQGSADMSQMPYPNPTQAAIRLPYQLAQGQTGAIDIYTVSGQQVAHLTVDGTFNCLNFDAAGLSKGIYFYQLTSTGGSGSRQRFEVR